MTRNGQQELPIARVETHEARLLADLAAIVQELGSILKICSRLKETLHDSKEDSILIECLWTTALIKYARCFASGKRFGLDESLFSGLAGDPIGVHRNYIAMRNKHIAHSVNLFEQMEVGLVLSSPDQDKREVVGVATLSMRHIVADVDGVHQLGMLAKVALNKACMIAKEKEKEILRYGKALPIGELYKKSRPRLTAPGPEKAGRPRE